MAVNEDVPYALPSLLELAYHACNSYQRKQYDKLPIMSIDLQVCCESILKIIKFNSDVNCFLPYGNRRFMFNKVQPDYRLSNNICEIAASCGHINCMKLARAIGVPWLTQTPWQRSACDEAAKSGNIECLVFAYRNGSPWNSWTCNFAASNGHLDCLKYLHDNGCPWDTYTCCMAALGGHLECLKYSRENGCPWDTFTCQMAASSGELECLKYARANGCPWNEKTCIVAAYFGEINCLRYAYENGCEWDVEGYLSTLDEMKHLSCVMYALEIKNRS